MDICYCAEVFISCVNKPNLVADAIYTAGVERSF